jgi:hypothetical protein
MAGSGLFFGAQPLPTSAVWGTHAQRPTAHGQYLSWIYYETDTGVTFLCTKEASSTYAWTQIVPATIGVEVVVLDHIADANNTGTSETILYSDGLSAGRLTTNKDKVFAKYGGSFSGGVSETQQLRVYFGPNGSNADTLIFDSGALSIGATPIGGSSWAMDIIGIRESSSIVRFTCTVLSGSFFYDTVYTKVTGLTLSNNQFVTLTGTAGGAFGGSNQITASMGTIWYKPSS